MRSEGGRTGPTHQNTLNIRKNLNFIIKLGGNMIRVYLVLITILCFALLFSCSSEENSTSCSGRGCNKPAPYSKMTLGNSESSLKYFITPSFSEIGENAVKSGINLAKNFLGTAYPVRIYLLAPNKAITEYSGFSSDWCTFMGKSFDNCGDSQISTAQNGGGQYFASGIDSCESCGNTNSGAGVFILPRDQDMKSNLAYRGIHEYTHISPKSLWRYYTDLVDGRWSSTYGVCDGTTSRQQYIFTMF